MNAFHTADCEWHHDQYPNECTCGLTAPYRGWTKPHPEIAGKTGDEHAERSEGGSMTKERTMLKKKTGYQVGDRWFDKKSDAAAHLARTQLDDLIQKSDYEPAELADWMIAQEWRLINVLSDIARRGGAAKKGAA